MTREDEIFKKLKKGDESGVAGLVELYYEDVLRYCMFRLSDRYLAEDAVQETFLKVFRYFDDYRHRGRFRAFLYKVAGNTCIDMMRKKRWDPIPEDAAQEEKGIQKTEEREDFLQIIRKLLRTEMEQGEEGTGYKEGSDKTEIRKGGRAK